MVPAKVAVALLSPRIKTPGALLLATKLFARLVPALIGLSTLIFAFGSHIQAVLSQRFGNRDDVIRHALLLPTSIYGGYFGAGLGVMLLAVLMVTVVFNVMFILDTSRKLRDEEAQANGKNSQNSRAPYNAFSVGTRLAH